MTTDDLYGSLDDELERVRAAMERAMGITLYACHSRYRGHHYCYGDPGAEVLILQRNWDPLDQECMEDQFPEVRILLYVSAGARAADLAHRLRSSSIWRLVRRADQ